MSRRREDEVDVAAGSWALQWLSNFVKVPDRAGRMVGPLGCTLGRVMERHDGAASSTEHARRWPEVWLGRALIVAVAYGVLNEMQRRVFWAHYVGRCYDLTTGQKRRYPLRQGVVAARLGIEIDEYHARRDVAKACIWAALQGEVALPPSKVVDSTQGGVLPPTAFH